MSTDRAVAHLQQLVRIPTVSRVDESLIEWKHFDEFIATVETLYPLVHSALERELVAGHSLLFRWAGRSRDEPTVLMAHYDVVPATDEGWSHPPFAAEVTGDGDDAVIWGRGTLDDKGALVSILEAVESQLATGYLPSNDIYLSFGHNEESMGHGAIAIVDLLESRGIRPALVIDEGGAVVEGVFPGVTKPVAVVGVSEKGILGLSLTVQQEGGHASTPPRVTATARLARAIVRLNDHPFPAKFTPTNIEMLETMGAHASGIYRFLFSNLWLTKRLILFAFGRLSDETNAVTRTTQAVTMLSGSMASNALAERAVATVNIRIAAGSSVAESVEHVRRAIRDPKVVITVDEPGEPSPVSPTSGRAWELLTSTITSIFPGTAVTPYVMLGATDGRHFTRISSHVYRFSPFEMSSDERGTLHAINERMHVSTFLRGIEFYRTLIAGL